MKRFAVWLLVPSNQAATSELGAGISGQITNSTCAVIAGASATFDPRIAVEEFEHVLEVA